MSRSRKKPPDDVAATLGTRGSATGKGWPTFNEADNLIPADEPVMFMRPSGGTGNGTNVSEDIAQPLMADTIDAVFVPSGERPRRTDPETRAPRTTDGDDSHAPLTVFSTFSGVGGLDLGLERAGWRVLAHCEIEPYANAVLALRWPDVPNLGDIVALRDREVGDDLQPDGGDLGGGGEHGVHGSAPGGDGTPGGRGLGAGGDGAEPGSVADGRGLRQSAGREGLVGGGDGTVAAVEGGPLGRAGSAGGAGERPDARSADGADGSERAGDLGGDGAHAGRDGEPGGLPGGGRPRGSDLQGEPPASGREPDVRPDPDGGAEGQPADERPGGDGGHGTDARDGDERDGRRSPGPGGADPADGAGHEERGDERAVGDAADRGSLVRGPRPGDPDDWRGATVWVGGFPCQDLSVAGKRRGMGTNDDRADTRSGLAYAFLDLVASANARGMGPSAIVLENVPGLLSSHSGRDFYALQRRLAELGYVGAYRILDARFYGVPQRRRRVFILALRVPGDDPDGRATAERAAEVLLVGASECRHSAPSGEAWEGAAPDAGEGVEESRGWLPAATARLAQGVLGHNGGDDYVTPVAAGLRASDGHHGHGSPRGDGSDNLVAAHGVAADGADATRTLGANMGHHGYALGTQDIDGGYLQVASTLTSSQERFEHPGDQTYIADIAHPLNTQRGHYDPDIDNYLAVGSLRASGNVGGASADADGVRSLDGLDGVHPGGDGAVSPDGSERRLDDRAGLEGEVTPAVTVANESGQGWWNDVTDGAVGAVRAQDGKQDSTVIAFTQNQREEIRDLGGVAGSLSGEGSHQTTYLAASNPTVFTKAKRAQTDQDDETWVEGEVSPTLNAFDVGDTRAVTAIVSPALNGSPVTNKAPDTQAYVEAGGLTAESGQVTSLSASFGAGGPDAAHAQAGWLVPSPPYDPENDPLLPPGLDSHRYRCCGNGVVAPVAEWIGMRLGMYFRGELDADIEKALGSLR